MQGKQMRHSPAHGLQREDAQLMEREGLHLVLQKLGLEVGQELIVVAQFFLQRRHEAEADEADLAFGNPLLAELVHDVEHPAQVGQAKRQLNHRRRELVSVTGVYDEAADVISLSFASKNDSFDALEGEK